MNQIPIMNHGTITVKKDVVDVGGDDVLRKVGEEGVITAFLPEDDVYAVMFDGKMGVGNWFTFDKVSFDMFCEIKQLT